MDRSRIAIVIPALNESVTIAGIVEAVGIFGVPIVVDDGSTDDTAKLAIQAGAVLVSHEKRQGYDAALDAGFRRAVELGCDLVVTMDADGQHNPDLLAQFIQELSQGADIVMGVRDKQQRIGEKIFAFVTKILWGINDPLCGMKGYRLSLYRQRGHFDSFGSIGTELALYAVRNHFRLSQLAVTTRMRIDAPRFGRAFTANRKIIRAMILALWITSPKLDKS
jgi:glycosyltransferase involved in cell wall biosynthesis